MHVVLQRKDVARGNSNQHVVIFKADPKFYRPLPAATIHVPDGGAGWAFILTTVAIVAFAAAKRYGDRIFTKGLFTR